MTICPGLRTIFCGSIISLIMSLSPALGETLKVGGTGAATGLLVQLGPAFKADTGLDLEVIAGLGSGGAISAVTDGRLGLVFSARDLTSQEKARGLKVATTFRTPFGLVTSRAGPDNLKSTEIAGLYSGNGSAWSDGMPMLVTLRPVGESDNALLGALFPGMTEAITNLRKRRDISMSATDQDNADMAEKIKGSVAGAALTQIVTEKRNLRFVSIDGVAATLENYENGSYSYGKTLYVIVPAVVSPQAAAFLTFLGKPAGQRLLRNAAVVDGK